MLILALCGVEVIVMLSLVVRLLRHYDSISLSLVHPYTVLQGCPVISGILVVCLNLRDKLAVSRHLRIGIEKIYLICNRLISYIGLCGHSPDDLILLRSEDIGHDQRLLIHPPGYALCLQVIILIDDIYMLSCHIVDIVLKCLRAYEALVIV